MTEDFNTNELEEFNIPEYVIDTIIHVGNLTEDIVEDAAERLVAKFESDDYEDLESVSEDNVKKIVLINLLILLHDENKLSDESFNKLLEFMLEEDF